LQRCANPFGYLLKKVKLFFKSARKITLEEFDHSADWLPCYMAGSARVEQTLIEWKISASGVAKVWMPSKHEPMLLLACDEDCQLLVFH